MSNQNSLPKTNWIRSHRKLVGSLIVVAVAVASFFYFFSFDLNLNMRKHDSIGEQAKNAIAPSASAAEIHSECEGKASPGEKFDCYAGDFDVYMRANGGKKTLELLQQLNDLGGYAQTNCHPLSHKVGNIALHVYGSIPAASPEYIPTCSSGYYHGLLEEYLATAPSYEQGLVTACGDANKEIFFNWFQCTHGEGHGIMQYRDDEVPQSLADCDQLADVKQAREICYAGVFMENITTDEKTGHKAKYINLEDPLYPCNAPENVIAHKYKSACYFLASSQILKINGWDFPDAFKECARVEDEFRWLCFQSLGRDVSGSNLSGGLSTSIPKVIEMCQYGTDPRDNANCFYGAVRDFINLKGEFATGVNLCSAVPDQYKLNCFDAIYLDLGLYKRGQDFINICATMPEPYRTNCRGRVINW